MNELIEEKPIRKKKRMYESISEEDFSKILEATRKELHRIVYILAYGSGLRISEITSLQPTDINLKEHKLFIRQGKGNKDRVVNTPKWLRQTHINYFPVQIGVRAIQKAFLRVTLKIGLNSILYTDVNGKPRYRYHFHSLRHSYATRALEKGVPINQVQLLLGHESLATTSFYLKANPVDAINSILDRGV